MPKEIKTYQCEKCKTIHDGLIAAEKCENSHLEIIQYAKVYKNSSSSVPDFIEIIVIGPKGNTRHVYSPYIPPPAQAV